MKLNILLIEDNPGDIELISDYLKDGLKNYALKIVKTFNKTKELLGNDEYTPDLILLDLSLPDMSGESLIKATLNLFPESPVIVLTGLKDYQFSIRSLEIGVADYLFKDELEHKILANSILHTIQRKKYLRSLKSTEEKYKRFFDRNSSPIFVWDNEMQRIIDCNQAALTTYGYTLSEFYQMSVKQIHPLNDPFENTDLNSNYNSHVLKHTTKAGKILYMKLAAYLRNFDKARASLVVFENVTEKYQSDEDAEQYFFQTLFKNSNHLKLLLDENDYQIISTSKKARKLFLQKNVIVRPKFSDFLSSKEKEHFELICSLFNEQGLETGFAGIFQINSSSEPGEYEIYLNRIKYHGKQVYYLELKPVKILENIVHKNKNTSDYSTRS